MKNANNSFPQTMLASLLGFILGSLILSALGFIVFAAMVGAAMSSSSVSPMVKPNTILTISLKQPIVDRATNNPEAMLQSLRSGNGGPIGLNEILRGIKKAESDDNIRGIFLTDLRRADAEIATLAEIREALQSFHLTGKFIISYSEYYAQMPYYLATASDKIYVNPMGDVDLHGLGAQVMFYKGLLDKVGVEVQVLRHGKFKSAVEPFMYDKMSAENREQTMAYAGSIWNELLKGIAEARRLEPARLTAMIDNLELTDVNVALKNNLVDGVRQRSEVLDELSSLVQVESGKQPNFIGIAEYGKTATLPQDDDKNKLAVVYAEGDIVDEGKGGIVGADLADVLRKIRRDTSYKAVVLRVNSPGGSALASELIWHEMKLLKESRPVVVSMGGIAASGGYYISCPATQVLASPTTITGSIGVFGLALNMKKLMNDKLGLTVDVAATNAHADMGSPFRPLTSAEQKFLQHGVEQTYGTFTQHVADGRGMAQDSVDAIGQGRVWSGVDAKRLRLIDEFGGLNAAIERATELAGLEKYTLQEFPRRKPTMEVVMEALGMASAKIFAPHSGTLMDSEAVQSILRNDRKVLARMPYEVDMQ